MTRSGAYIGDDETWSLPELVTWIMTRDWSEVRDSAPTNLESPGKCDGSEIMRLKYRRRDEKYGGDPDKLWEQITAHVIEPKFRLWGKYKNSERIVEIVQKDWVMKRLVFDEVLEFEGLKRVSDDMPWSKPEWNGLRFAIEDALTVWPGPSRPEEASRTEPDIGESRKSPTTAGAERRCQGWLECQMRTGSKTKRKIAYFEEAKTKFKVSRRGFDRAWANAIISTNAAGWNKPGRISGQCIDTPDKS